MEPMPIALNVGQIWNQCWWRHLVVKFWTNTSGTTYNWPNLEPMKVEFFLAGDITQVIDSIPWVRCASGNVFCGEHDVQVKTQAWRYLFQPPTKRLLCLSQQTAMQTESQCEFQPQANVFRPQNQIVTTNFCNSVSPQTWPFVCLLVVGVLQFVPWLKRNMKLA